MPSEHFWKKNSIKRKNKRSVFVFTRNLRSRTCFKGSTKKNLTTFEELGGRREGQVFWLCLVKPCFKINKTKPPSFPGLPACQKIVHIFPFLAMDAYLFGVMNSWEAGKSYVKMYPNKHKEFYPIIFWRQPHPTPQNPSNRFQFVKPYLMP